MKKNIALCLAALAALSSCGMGAEFSSTSRQFEDGIYYKPTTDPTAVAVEQTETDALLAETQSAELFLRGGQNDTLVLPQGKSATLQYKPDRTIVVNVYDTPDWYGSYSWAWSPWYMRGWYGYRPWADPWYYDPWYRTWSWGSPYGYYGRYGWGWHSSWYYDPWYWDSWCYDPWYYDWYGPYYGGYYGGYWGHHYWGYPYYGYYGVGGYYHHHHYDGHFGRHRYQEPASFAGRSHVTGTTHSPAVPGSRPPARPVRPGRSVPPVPPRIRQPAAPPRPPSPVPLPA